MKNIVIVSATVGFLWLTLSHHPPAGAAPGKSPQTQDDARRKEVARLLQKGYELRLAGQDAEGLKLFGEAYALEPSGKVLMLMASAEQELGRWLDAEKHATEARATMDPYVKKNRKYIDETLASVGKHIGELEVGGPQTEGAAVVINGLKRGAVPVTVRINEGSADVEVGKLGFLTWKSTVIVKGGDVTRIVADLVPERPVPTLAEVIPDIPATRPLLTAGEDTKPRSKRTAGWVTAGAGVAVAAFGAGLWAIDGSMLDNGKRADTHGGPVLLGLGVVTTVVGVYLIRGSF